MLATGSSLEFGKVAGAGKTPVAAGRWAMSAFTYQVVGFLVVWLMIVLSMVVVG